MSSRFQSAADNRSQPSEEYQPRPSAAAASAPQRILIPVLPSDPEDVIHSLQHEMPSSMTPEDHVEYAQFQHPSSQLEAHLPAAAAIAHREQGQRAHLHRARMKELEKVWEGSKPHLRKHEKLVKELGSAEAAAAELVNPTRLSFRAELEQRPLDKGILEEIYMNLHGKRIERRLKKGVSWEHWITKGDGTAPVFTASRKAQQTFGMGTQVKLVGSASDASQFPTSAAFSGKRNKISSVGGSDTTNSKLEGKTAKRHVDMALPPEVAFVGRTSSGKSSLINALLNAAVAPYGHLQGTTTSVSFYAIGQAVTLVDCPGYGYYNPFQAPEVEAQNAVRVMRAYLQQGATLRPQPQQRMKRKKQHQLSHRRRREGKGESNTASLVSQQEEKQQGKRREKKEVEEEEMNEDGVSSSELLTAPTLPFSSLTPVRPVKRVFLCVSSRGLQHVDWAYCDFLESLGVPFSVVLTKTDAAPIRFLARLADYTRCRLVHYRYCKELMLTSSLRLAGIDKMQNLISSMARQTTHSGTASSFLFNSSSSSTGKAHNGMEEKLDFSSIV